ncbi:hypothetical protein COPEUT_01241 [Coprococcus eutactus ATCC 27759]|nr:hypothetical protein COPEUT_01241 [Coprococcus eutactus ATCC 27759]
MNRRFLNWGNLLSKPQSSYTEYIGIGREPPELKHLVGEREGNIDSVVAASESEEPNRSACTPGWTATGMQ